MVAITSIIYDDYQQVSRKQPSEQGKGEGVPSRELHRQAFGDLKEISEYGEPEAALGCWRRPRASCPGLAGSPGQRGQRQGPPNLKVGRAAFCGHVLGQGKERLRAGAGCMGRWGAHKGSKAAPSVMG